MKTNKSYSKRVKVTKNGKVVARRAGRNHFNAKQTGRERLSKRRTQRLSLTKKAIQRFLPKSGA